MKILFTFLTLILFCEVNLAQKEVYIPNYLRDTNIVDGKQFSWDKTAESENFIVIWGDSSNLDPLLASNPELRFNPESILDTMEFIFDAFAELGFIQDTFGTNLNQYKVPIIMLNTFGPTGVQGWAFGGDVDGIIGAFWAHPLAMQDGGVAAHEFTHSLQAQVNIDYRAINSLGIVWQNSGIFWETHANFMRNILYPRAASAVLMDLYGMEAWGQWKNTYENYHLLFAIEEEDGIDIINRMWRESFSEEYPIAAYKRLMGIDQKELNDKMYKYARRMATLDFPLNNIGTFMRENREFHLWNFLPVLQTVHTILKKNPENANHFIAPYELAPEEYGYNIIPLNPIQDSCAVIIKFKGHTDANSFAGWRYGFVTSLSDGTISRYSEIYSAVEDSIAFSLESHETQMYLVVMGAPNEITTSPDNDTWKGYPKHYRFPYELTITGALPEGHQAPTEFRSYLKTNGNIHPNGGGWVASSATVDNSVYVGPYAMVVGNSNLTGEVQILDAAIVQDATISGEVKVKDVAMVLGGNISENAVIGGLAFVENCNIYGNALIDMRARVSNYELHGDIHVGGDVIVYNATGNCDNGVYFRMTNFFADNLLECDQRTEDHPDNVDVNNSINYFPTEDMFFACDCENYPECSPVSVNESETSGYMLIFPNPASDFIRVDLGETFKGGCNVAIYNSVGAKLTSIDNKQKFFEIDLSSYTDGMYYLVFSNGNTYAQEKIIIKK